MKNPEIRKYKDSWVVILGLNSFNFKTMKEAQAFAWGISIGYHQIASEMADSFADSYANSIENPRAESV